MIRLVDITFHTNTEYADTTALLKAQQASLFYIDAIRHKLSVEVIKHVSVSTKIIEKENHKFFVGKNKRGYISPETIDHLKALKPQVIIVHGLGFPLQVLRLKMLFGKKVKILVWHHAERPSPFPGKVLYGLADLCASKYLFTSKENAAEWIAAGIICHQNKIVEIPPTLTVFTGQERSIARQKTGMQKGQHYLWVGRLDVVKDPLTVIDAFEKFIAQNHDAKLHLIFSGGAFLKVIQEKIQNHPALKGSVVLHGHIPNEELELWYSAADFFISSSLREAGSVTILEAMACGCIPIVTAIPASLKVTGDGMYGFNYPVGDVDGLVKILFATGRINREEYAEKVQLFYKKTFSVSSVAGKLAGVCESLLRK